MKDFQELVPDGFFIIGVFAGCGDIASTEECLSSLANRYNVPLEH